MANTDAPMGFYPYRHAHGGTVRMAEYAIADGYATSIFTGDSVKLTGTSRQVEAAAAGDTMIGVFAGCQYIDDQGDVQYKQYWPASTSIKSGTVAKAWVIDDPFVEFVIQADGDFAAADIGNTADHVAGSGDTATGRSRYELDSSNIGSGAGLLIRDLAPLEDNAYGTNAKVVVRINEHSLNTGTYTAV